MQNEERQLSQTQPCKPEQKGGHATLVSQNSIPETKPLSTLLGETPAPLVIQNSKQNISSWSSSDTSSLEPPRALKSQDINTDFFRDFGKDPFAQNTTAKSNAPISDAQNTGEFMTQGFAVFPSSTSAGSFFDQQPNMPSQQKVKTPATDKYAALADLDSLFNQPTQPATTTETAWSATGIRTSSVLGVTPTTGLVYGTGASNPFATNTAPTWNQPGPGYPEQQSYFSCAGSFQGTFPQAAVYGVQAPTQGGSSFGQYGTPTPISASEVNYGAFTGASASNTSFGFSPGGFRVMNSSETVTANHARVQNGGFGVGAITAGWPVGGMTSDGVQSSGVMWNVGTGQQVHMNMFPGNKLDGYLQQQQPLQVSANPFTVANGSTQPVKSNLGNPFL
ncbi:arf-GAP domain and FG repeat-containing protein 2-like isoform X2 [Limulus polyphemus]|uniref:Arf-GAP domain and FG repeat-containing protein 2-like isoform X2 n=1 Tax=Limulus polyphemus TaxID=6850 RepID=A0ABM1BUE5_LIMPO|nr:arf-GAP domain and FG repeat-containing protein 2-like isoform X2 [Limulus polyphemus]